VTPASAWYDAGASVTVTATAQPGWLFLGFSGASTSTVSPILLVMDAPATVVAHFAPLPTVHSPDPADGAVSVPVTVALDWEGENVDAFDLYFWKADEGRPDEPTTSGLTASTYAIPANLDYRTTYGWQVVAANAWAVTTGSQWSFATMAQAEEENVYHEDFLTTEPEWIWVHARPAFTEPTSGTRPGALTITATNNEDNFGFWQSPDAAVSAEGTPEIEAGTLYRARYWISSGVADKAQVPAIRLRTQDVFLTQANYVQIESQGTASLSPTTTAAPYDLYFEGGQVIGGSNYLAFELINFQGADAADGDIALELAEVKSMALADLPGAKRLATYDFAGDDPQGWVSSGADEFEWFFEPTTGVVNNRLVLTADNNSTHTFGYFLSPEIAVSEAARLVRATFIVGSDEPDRKRTPGMRLRVNQTDREQFAAVRVDSTGPDGNSPALGIDVVYTAYLVTPANDGLGLVLGFDMMSFEPQDSPNASLTLDSAIVEEFQIPLLP